MIKKSKKELYYKTATFLSPSALTLQEMILSSRISNIHADERELSNGDTILVWNNHTSRPPLDLGMLHSYERGKSQLIVATAKQVAEYHVMESPPPASKTQGEKLEFNEGLLFFGVYKNHVIILQSAALKVGRLEDYFNWLIRKNGHLDKNRLELRDPLPKELRSVNSPPLRTITITPSVGVETKSDDSDIVSSDKPATNKRKRKKDIKVSVEKKIWTPLKLLFESMGAHVPEELNFDGAFNPGLVELSIELSWRGRKKDRDHTPILDTILHAFQDVDNPPIEAITANGDKISGDKLRLRKTVSVDVQGKIPIYTDVYKHMQDYLAELVARGEVDV